MAKTIVFASSKGGAGKTTAAVILACELARQGQPKGIGVSLIDADPNQHSAAWAQLEGKPDNIALHAKVTEDNILDTIEDAQGQTPLVLVDLEGVASSAVLAAISRADLVIIPCQPSQNDAREAAKTIKTIKTSSRITQRHIPFSVLFTRLSAAIVTKTSKHLTEEFNQAGIDVFDCSLIDREAFKSIFSFGGTIYDLEASTKKAQQSIDRARDNAQLLAEELKRHLIQHTTQEAQQIKEVSHV